MKPLVLLSLAALLSSAGAAAAAAPDEAGLFDGTAAKVELAQPRFKPAPAPASRRDGSARPDPQSGADLYYFSPAQAAAAARRFGIRELAPAPGGFAFDKDVPADIQAQMRADLAFIGTIRGSGATPLHRQIFGAVDGQGYLSFFNSRVTGVGLDDCGDSKAVACVIPFYDPSKMWLTQNYIKFSHPQIARLMIVFHEARHTETQNGNWPHATCPTPFLDGAGHEVKSIWTGSSLGGEAACDTTPFGSYGSSTIMLKNIQKYCANCTDKVKMDAGLYADDQLGRITDAGARQRMTEDFKRP